MTGDPVNGRGAVQLFDETHGWIDVCYDSTWLDDEANVVCRQLGYESGTARLYRSVSLIPKSVDEVHDVSSFLLRTESQSVNDVMFSVALHLQVGQHTLFSVMRMRMKP